MAEGRRRDLRRGRYWLKVQLRQDADSEHVLQIIQYWKGLKTATMHVTRAIRIYYALTQGDTSLLNQHFPFLLSQPASSPPTPTYAPVEIPGAVKMRLVEKSADEDIDDFLESMGLE